MFFCRICILRFVTIVLICKYYTNGVSPILNTKTTSICSLILYLLVIENMFNFGNEHPWMVKLIEIFV